MFHNIYIRYEAYIYDMNSLDLSWLGFFCISVLWCRFGDSGLSTRSSFQRHKSKSMEWLVQLEISEKKLLILAQEKANLSQNLRIIHPLITLNHQSTLLWILYNWFELKHKLMENELHDADPVIRTEGTLSDQCLHDASKPRKFFLWARDQDRI